MMDADYVSVALKLLALNSEKIKYRRVFKVLNCANLKLLGHVDILNGVLVLELQEGVSTSSEA